MSAAGAELGMTRGAEQGATCGAAGTASCSGLRWTAMPRQLQLRQLLWVG